MIEDTFLALICELRDAEKLNSAAIVAEIVRRIKETGDPLALEEASRVAATLANDVWYEL